MVLSKEDARGLIQFAIYNNVPVTPNTARRLYTIAEWEMPGYLLLPVIDHIKLNPRDEQTRKLYDSLITNIHSSMGVPARYL